jgi:calmodulin
MFWIFLFKDMPLADNEAQLLLGSADEDHSGGIDMREFLSIMTTPINQQDLEEELRGTFNVFDKDGNGTINANELKRFVRVSLKRN